ncbi:biotin/lipoyl-binding protein [Pseudofulvimonas gallinarii]|uniref:biotin/lipoyl-binding protein n=1 Tax=Pseudofulvimonas gallinarii TaxID=634155 RepID=UPI000F49F3FF|nr:biotin/lipoyl-binding protein [Pseudofulvimonas gallinarii]
MADTSSPKPTGIRPAPRAGAAPSARRRPRWPLFLGVAAIVAVLAWWLWPAAGEVRYRTAKVDTGTIRVAIAATGKLSALSTVDVGSQVSGLVLSVEVDYNDRVEAGQAIAHRTRRISVRAWNSRKPTSPARWPTSMPPAPMPARRRRRCAMPRPTTSASPRSGNAA